MRTCCSRCFALVLVVLTAMPARRAAAEIELIGTARFPGDSEDRSGLTDLLEGGIPHNRLGGISAVEFTGRDDRYLLLPDRGPLDGATEYRCRVHELKLAVRPKQSPAVVAELVATKFLVDEADRPLVGSAAAFDAADPAGGQRFDPEGIRIDRRGGGDTFISDEYGPGVYRFSAAGKRTFVFPVSDRFRVTHPAATPSEESAQNAKGRQPNGGLEGLAITPDGKKLYAAMQRPLIQESVPSSNGKRTGTKTRIIEFELPEGKTREFLYSLDDTSHGVSEILAINDHEFLVLERDGKAGGEATAKKIFKVDLADSSDISDRDTLPARGPAEGVKPARKSLFLDLLAPQFGLRGAETPEKVEGLAFGPDLPDGRRLLIVAVDNDFVKEKPILLHAFAIDRDELPAFGW